jgi:hypothetical protein
MTLQLFEEIVNRNTFIPIKPKNLVGRLQKVPQMTFLFVFATTLVFKSTTRIATT